MLKLYSAPRTRSIRVPWLLEEMDIPYQLISGEFRQTGSRFFIKATPTGKHPTIDDDGVVFREVGVWGAQAVRLLRAFQRSVTVPSALTDHRLPDFPLLATGIGAIQREQFAGIVDSPQ